MYFDDNTSILYTASELVAGNIISVKGLILDNNEEQSSIDTGWINIENPNTSVYSVWNTKYRKIGDDVDIYVDIKTTSSISYDSYGIANLCTLPSEIIPSRTIRQIGYILTSTNRTTTVFSINSSNLKIYNTDKNESTIPSGTAIYGELRYFI